MKNKAVALLAALGLSAGTLLAAPIGTAFNYQGQLRTSAAPATGLFDFEFTLWTALSGPAQAAGPLTLSALPVTNGLFNAALDFGPGVVLSEARWLEIAVRTNGASGFVTLSPRQQLTPAPSAIFSSFSGNADNAATSSIATAVSPGAVMAGSIASGQVVKSLDGLKDVVALKAGTNMSILTNSGANSLTLAAGPWQPFQETNTYLSGGRVGIGMAPNQATLEVVSSDAQSGSIHVGGYNANTNPKLIHFGDMQAGGNGFVYIGENGEDDRMELRAGRFHFNYGNVGIQKTNPVTALDVAGTVTATGFSGPGAGLTSLNANSLSSGMVSDGRLSANVALLNANQTFTAPKTFVQPIGIGGAPFAALLDVEGDIRLNMHDLLLREGNDIYHGLGWYGADKTWNGVNLDGPVLYGCGGGGLGTLCNSNLALRWLPGGNVIIDPLNQNAGTLSASVPALIFGDGSGEGIASRRVEGGNRFGLDFYTSFANRMTIDNSGNVGIGTLTPAAKLDVMGMVKTPNVGTLDRTPFTASMDGMAGFRLEAGDLYYHTNYRGINVTLGSPANWISPNAHFCTISGGGVDTGGASNCIKGACSGGTIGGGYGNSIDGWSGAVIAGGEYNTIEAGNAAIGGGSGNHIQYYASRSTIGGGSGNRIQTNASYSTIGGGQDNTIVTNGESCTIAGGENNTAEATCTTIGGGSMNHIHYKASYSTIGGGSGNTILTNCMSCTIAGGAGNLIHTNSGWSTIGGGGSNTIETNSGYCTIVGGRDNHIRLGVENATVLGGYNNVVEGENSVAAGYRAKARMKGTFVWADSSPYDFDPLTMTSAAGRTNSFTVRAVGGVFFITGINSSGIQTAGPICYPGAGSFTSYSDRNSKQNFASVNTRAILDKVVAMPIETWNYKAQETSIRHIGPMAQDFKAAFQLGESDKGIASIDADGVALAAIQGLNKKLEEQAQDKEARIKSLESKIAELQALVEKLALQNHHRGAAGE